MKVTIRLRDGRMHKYYDALSVTDENERLAVRLPYRDLGPIPFESNDFLSRATSWDSATDYYDISEVQGWAVDYSPAPQSNTENGLRAELAEAKHRLGEEICRADRFANVIDRAIRAAGPPRTLGRKEANETLNRVVEHLRVYDHGGSPERRPGVVVDGLGAASVKIFQAEKRRAEAERARDEAFRQRDAAVRQRDNANARLRRAREALGRDS